MKIRGAAALAFLALLAIAPGCSHRIDSPSITAGGVAPDLLCVEQLTTQVTLSGEGFTPMPSQTLTMPALLLPQVELDLTENLTGGAASGKITLTDDPANPAASLLRWTSEEQLAFDVTPALAVQPGLYDIHVTNADGTHTAAFPGALAGVPRPTVKSVAPDVLCDDDASQTLTLTGMNFLEIGPTMPVVDIDGLPFTPTSLGGCTAVPGKLTEGTVQECTSATVLLRKGAFKPGSFAVTVTNPSPASCTSSDPVTLTVVAPPSVLAAVPDLACDAQTMTLTGTGFLTVEKTLPSLDVGGQMIVPASAGGCTPVAGMFAEGEVTECTSLTFVLPGGFLEGDYPVVVTNPMPAGCTSTEMITFHVAPPPAVVSVAPVALCDAQGAQVVQVTGTGFLQLGTGPQLPSVAFGAKAPITASAAMGCVAVPGTFAEGTAQECTGLTVSIPQGTLAPGNYAVVVTNPLPANCGSTQAVNLRIDGPPVVTSALPAQLCVGGGTVTLTGSGFLATATASLQPNPANGQATVPAGATLFSMGGEQLAAVFPPGASVGATYDVVVDDEDGCSDASPHQQVTIKAGPVAFYADPSVVDSAVNTSVLIFSSALVVGQPASPTLSANIVPTGQAGPLTSLEPQLPTPLRTNVTTGTVPSGTPVGVYDLILSDNTGCQSVLPKAITVASLATSSPFVTIQSVSPDFGYVPASAPAFTLLRDKNAAPPGNGPFLATPRIFLNPTNPQAGVVASELEQVVFVDDATLTATVRGVSTPGVYDVIVVNDDGTMGVLPASYTVTSAAPPPIVSSVFPGIEAGVAGQTLTAIGTGFAAATIDSMTCVDAAGKALLAPVVSGSVTCTAPSCTQTMTVDGTSLTVGATCVLRVTNPDGSFFDFSAVGVNDVTRNLAAARAGTTLNVGRRALSAAVSSTTPGVRFLYAIGGDGGLAMAGVPFGSTEFAAIDPAGVLGAWTVEPAKLNTPRSFAAEATVGRYLYVMGGNNGTTAVASAERAMILNPLEVPGADFNDLVPATQGLAPGTWYYRVTATYGPSDPDNPSGESLSSAETLVRVPPFPGKNMQVSLLIGPPADSLHKTLPNLGYNIYRTSVANGLSGGEVLIQSVVVTGPPPQLFTDDGTAVPGTQTPPALGSTGNWVTLPAMGTARSGAAGAMALDPSTPATTAYVYALLGLDQNKNALTSYELLPVTLLANGHQPIPAAWKAGADTSAQGRWQLGAWALDDTVTPNLAGGATDIYLGGGLLAGGMPASTVEYGTVTAGTGDLGALTASAQPFPANAGYGVCAAFESLFAFGGDGATPSADAQAAKIPGLPTTLSPWAADGITLTDARYLMGSATSTTFVFLVGGQTGGAAAGKTTDLVVW